MKGQTALGGPLMKPLKGWFSFFDEGLNAFAVLGAGGVSVVIGGAWRY
jgi:hypothetical protein